MLNFLIIEHDEDEARNLRYFMNFVEESCFLVSDMQTAIDVLMACSIHFDALITSLGVPKEHKQLIFEPFGGIEIAQQAQLFRSGLPVFFCTKRGTADHQRIKKLPFDVGFIPRPARMEDIVTASFYLRHLKEAAVHARI
jgi:hypothetical protein